MDQIFFAKLARSGYTSLRRITCM